MAYKSADDIIDVIRDTVDIIDMLKPIYNFKAPWHQNHIQRVGDSFSVNEIKKNNICIDKVF